MSWVPLHTALLPWPVANSFTVWFEREPGSRRMKHLGRNTMEVQ